jgi:hypothetical protein
VDAAILHGLNALGDLDDLAGGFLGVGIGPVDGEFLAAILSSLSAPRMTIFSRSSGNGRCNALASCQGARIQTSRSSSVVKITGIALGWIGPTIALGDVGLHVGRRHQPHRMPQCLQLTGPMVR